MSRLLESRFTVYGLIGLGLLIRIAALVRAGGEFLYYENTVYDRLALRSSGL